MKLAIILAVIVAAIAGGFLLLSGDTPPENVTLNDAVTDGDLASDGRIMGAVKIGVLAPLTGDLSAHGEESKEGALYGIEQFNRHLESIGAEWYFDPVLEDTATNPVQALEKLQNLKSKNIELVIGPSSSASTSYVLQYADNNDMLVFSCCSSSPKLAISGDNGFRMVPDDRQQAYALAVLLRHEGIDAIVPTWRADPYGEGLSTNLISSFEQMGGVSDDGIKYNPESPEFSVSTSVLAERVSMMTEKYGPDNVAVVITGFAEVLQFMQSSSNHDILDKVRWFGSSSLAKEPVILSDPVGSKFAQKTKFTTLLIGFDDNPTSKMVERAVYEKLQRPLTTFTKTAYDIAWIYGLSVLAAESDRAADIRPVIFGVALEYDGATGNVTLNENGDLESGDYSIFTTADKVWKDVGIYNRTGIITVYADE